MFLVATFYCCSNLGRQEIVIGTAIGDKSPRTEARFTFLQNSRADFSVGTRHHLMNITVKQEVRASGATKKAVQAINLVQKILFIKN